MPDAVLKARLDALEQSLRWAESGSMWDGVRLDSEAEGSVKDALFQAIERQVAEGLHELERIRDLLRQASQAGSEQERRQQVSVAWQAYARALDQSRGFFRECLELLGALALRAMHAEGQIYHLADELTAQVFFDCYRQAWLGPAVPVLPETLIKTLARIIGLRFLEWTIWLLPLTAHELGHVLMENHPRLQGFVLERVALQDRQEAYLKELAADVFATYTLGPAYVCALLLLKCDPLTAQRAEPDSPSGVVRAHATLSMLRHMSAAAGGAYDPVVAHLAGEWRSLLERVGVAPDLEAAEIQWVESFVEAMESGLDDCLRPTGRYPHAGETSGWNVALTWSGAWREHLRQGGDGDLPAIEADQILAGSRLRDAFNAAWLSRLDNPEARERIAVAARRLCEAIVHKRKEAGRSDVVPGRR